MTRKSLFTQGFTLIELLVVIGILAILLAITLIAINPARQFSQANNTQRSSDVNAILNAVSQFQADNSGVLPLDDTGDAIPEESTCTTNLGTVDCTLGSAAVDLCQEIVPLYIASLPTDPTGGDTTPVEIADCTAGVPSWNTGYEIWVSSTNNRITVSAPDAELSATISVTR